MNIPRIEVSPPTAITVQPHPSEEFKLAARVEPHPSEECKGGAQFKFQSSILKLF